MKQPTKQPASRLLIVRTARKACEHITFAGASFDLVGFVAHYEAFLIVFAGKFAFVAGALAVYLLHAEESRTIRRNAARHNQVKKGV